MLELRARQRRNFVATLMLSQGVPMLSGGDEIGRTQHGNNNGYCQDNELSWYDWSDVDEEFLEWNRRLVNFQNQHPVFRRRRWFQGRQIRGIEDMAWFRPDGAEMSDDDWDSGYAKSVGVFMNGQSIQATDPYGGRVVDDTFLVLFNASEFDLDWALPDDRWGTWWVVDLDSADPHVGTPDRPTLYGRAGDPIIVTSRSLQVLRRTESAPSDAHPAKRAAAAHATKPAASPAAKKRATTSDTTTRRRSATKRPATTTEP